MGARREDWGVGEGELEAEAEGEVERKLPLSDDADDAAEPGRLVLDATGASASVGINRGVWGRDEGVEAEDDQGIEDDDVGRGISGSSTSACALRPHRKRAAPTRTSSGPDNLLPLRVRVPARSRAECSGAAETQS
jgi:hypothetical protein